MRKTLLTVGLIIVLVASMFVLTACNSVGEGEKSTGRKMVDITYDAPSMYSVKVSVPVDKSDSGEDLPIYAFVEKVPEEVKAYLSDSGVILAGDKIVATFVTTSYTYQTGVAYKEAHGDVTPSFEGFKEFINEEGSTSTLKGAEETTIGGREALKKEYRQGSGNGDLYGYYYVVNIDDLYPRGYMSITVVTADGKSESTEAIFSDTEVQSIIDSIEINGLSK